MRKAGVARVAAGAAALLCCSAAPGGAVSEIVGYDDLLARLGADVPTGAGVAVVQIEFPVGPNYGPDQSHPEFAGKTFIAPLSSPGLLTHATLVGRHQYGLTSSLAPGVDQIYLYDAVSFLSSGILKTQFVGQPPASFPGGVKLVNNSWLFQLGSFAVSNEALRRADLLAKRDDVLMTNGMNNGSPNPPLMMNMYNGIAVGRQDGLHTSGPSPTGLDGPGRVKPEIVAPVNSTSTATPLVNGAAAILVEAARRSTFDSAMTLTGSTAERTEVIKAVILAGAVHEDLADGSWWNGAPSSGASRGVAPRPFDLVMGAGTLQVDRSHLVLTGGEQNGGTSLAGAPPVTRRRGLIAIVNANGSAFWRVTLDGRADEISILATWHRRVADNFASFTLADFDLHLWRVDDEGSPVSLAGDAGLGWYDSGNVISASAIDNAEHIWVTGLAAGEYVIELRRNDALEPWDVAVAWLLPEVIAGDINGDGEVGFADLSAILTAWGPCPATGPCPEDLSGEGDVGFVDLTILLLAWDAR